MNVLVIPEDLNKILTSYCESPLKRTYAIRQEFKFRAGFWANSEYCKI
jgi:hypothetical protein